MTLYPSLAYVVQIHSYLIDQFGGSHGIRDSGGLMSAIARPRAGYYNDLIEEAAALMESLSQNHPFIDGNKRTAIAVSMGFLSANGYRLSFDSREAYQFFIGLYEAGKFNFRSLDKWLRKHVRMR
ncbi:MAG TPA: type II toxin-antitoxin system death-on-curing family toxin [Terriglobia bacterium]|nr:type II toxin-antitoxin system death-on-curing family toxin [Terriglobia bacterium]